MLLRELFEAGSKTAVLAFGRMNPPTIGHAKLVNKIKSIPGKHFLFLSHSQDKKKDPLDFNTKLKFAKAFFPGIEIGREGVNTPVAALQYIQSLGYTNVVFVAGSDRVEGFQKLFDTYNGTPDKSGKIPFQFDSITVVSAGERDPDADGAEGMSASKMRAAAIAGDFESFKQGTPDQNYAQQMYDSVRKSMGVEQPVSEDQGNITPELLKKLEYYLDQMFAALGIDVEFTRHFLDRANDERNVKPITIQELAKLFKDTYAKWGKKIAQLGPDAQAVIKDMSTDINVPFVLNWDNGKKELDLVAKTVMRKKNFTTPNQQFQVESADLKKNEPDLISAMEKFLPLAMQVLEIDKLPRIKLEKHLDHKGQPSFGRFVAETTTIHLAINDRHTVDILRTLAHELVHFKQLTDNKLDNNSGDTGSAEENEAHIKAGVVMRLFNKKYPNFFKEPAVNIEENFADGKVKGKSRPGRVKRAGASCKGSVTDLRRRAKVGGERGKMYHWCANMKSGRQKSESIVEFDEDEEIYYSKKLAPVAKKLFQTMYPEAKVKTVEDGDGYLSIETLDGIFGFSIGVSHQYGDNVISVGNAYAGNYRGIVGKLVKAAAELLQKKHPDAATTLVAQHDVSDNYWPQLANKLGIEYENNAW